MKLKQLQAIIIFLLLSIVADSQNTYPWPSSGNIGIGTSSPNLSGYAPGFTTLSVFGNGSDKFGQIELGGNRGANGNQHGVIRFFDLVTNHQVAGITSGNTTSFTDDGVLTFDVASHGAIATAMTINKMGNIGIGTQSPNLSGYPLGFTTLSVFGNGSDKFGQIELGGNRGAYGNQHGVIRFFDLVTNHQVAGITSGNTTSFTDDGVLTFDVANHGTIATAMTINKMGNVGIGITTPSEKLSVKGNIRAEKVIITATGWSDYVFESTYPLKPLSEVAKFIKQNQHLPDIPSAKEVEETGINVGDNQALLLKKIEELTLYLIDLAKNNEAQDLQIKEQQKEIQLLKRKMK